MKLIRALFVVAAVMIPASWTIAHAGDDMGAAGSGGMKKDKPKKKKKGDMGDKKGDMGDSKGDMDKK